MSLRLRVGVLAGVLLVAGGSSLGAHGSPDGSIVATVYVVPVDVEVVAATATVRQGGPATLRTMVVNDGPDPLTDVTVTLHTPEQVLLRGDADLDVGVIDPGEQRVDSWQVCAATAGNHVVLARVSATVIDVGREVVAESLARIVAVERGRGTCPSAFTGPPDG